LKTQGKKALLVGINKYEDLKLSNLRFSVNDATSINTILTDTDRGGFSTEHCLLITGRRRKRQFKPTRSNIMSSISSLSRTARSDDYILFFFSGHGIEEDGKPYLLPSDARINVLRDTALPIDWIKTTLEASRAHAKVLILDACHAGAMKGKSESGRMTKGLHDSLFPATEGFAILSSCKLHEVSWEMPEKKHGVFSHFLIEGLQGAADFDSDGRVMVSDASRYTAERTMEWSYAEGVQQTPNLESKVVGDLLLVNVPRLEELKVDKKTEKVKQDVSDLTPPISFIRIIPSDRFFEEGELDERLAAFVPYFCGRLLKHFAIDEIEYTDKSIVFPMGRFREESLFIELDYDPQELEKIDDMLIMGAEALQARTVVYFSSARFDISKIAKLLKTTKSKIIMYDPKLYHTEEGLKGFLEIEPNFLELKQRIRIEFFNRKKAGSGIVAMERERKALDKESIQMLRPTKLLRLLGDIWKRK